MQVKVSIFCTAYNHEEYLRQALESFVAQKTDFPFEVLLTDDASTDSTPQICAEYAEKYPDIIRYFHQEQNLFRQGIDVCKAVMYPNARGEYVAFCEGDDYLTDENKLQIQADFMDTHPEYSACVHNTYYHYCDGSRDDELLVPSTGDHDVTFEEILNGLHTVFHTSSFFVRRDYIVNPPDFQDVANEYGFTDYPMALWFSLGGKVRFIDRAMSVYRLDSVPESWTAGWHDDYKKKLQFVKGEIAMMETMLHHLDDGKRALTETEIEKRKYQLAYLEGRADDMMKSPFFREEPFAFRAKTLIKKSFPAIHRIYRDKKGYK